MSEIDELLRESKEGLQVLRDEYDKKSADMDEKVERAAAAVEKAQAGLDQLKKEQLARTGQDGRVRVRTGRLAGYDSLDLKILEQVMRSRKRTDTPPSERILEELAEARKDIRETMTVDSILGWEDRATRMASVLTPNTDALNQFRGTLSGWTRGLIAGHQRALDSTTTSAGDELVPTFEAAELWMDVNFDTLILPVMPQVTMPTNPFDIPAQLGDTNWYPVSENVQVTTTDVATAKATLTAYGLKTGVPFSDELEEDAIIAFTPELRRNLVRNAAEVIDDVILNADTTTTNNINADGTTIGTSTAGKAHWLLGFDGLIHLPLVDNTSQYEDHSAAISADVFNEMLARLGKYGAPRRRGDVVYIVDIRTAIRALSMTEVETVDTAAQRATMSTGEIAVLYGVPLIRSDVMKLAEDGDGKVTSGGNSTDVGRILCVNTTQWRVGFRRQVTVETEREAGKGQTTMYVSFRIALTERTGTRSSATHTSLAWDITGV